jgi:predicted TIM-barrel fold metal-dependent hydrolase
MRYFDANCYLGLFNHWSGTQPIARGDILRAMDHYGIHQALVVASMAREYGPMDGNKQVLQLTGGHPRLQPAFVAVPPRSREAPTSDDLVAQMAEQGVRAVFLYPRQYRFTLDQWCVDTLLESLAARRVPVFICPNTFLGGGTIYDQTDWPNIVRVCQAFPELPVIVAEARIFNEVRTMYGALEACPNLYLDMSALWIHHMVEFICREWGAERLLFGSGLPARDPGAVLSQLNYSDITSDELTAIAGGNLQRLLSWNPDPPLPEPNVSFSAPVDELHDMTRSRKPLRGQQFFCGHGHIGPHCSTHIIDGSPAQLAAEMDRLGVAGGIVFASAGLNSNEVYGNDVVARALRQYPDRFVGFVSVNLNRPVPEIRREMDRGMRMGMCGIKMHPALSGYDTNGPNVELVCAFADERNAFVLNHNWGSTDRILYLCRKYPNACFMTGHTSADAFPAVKQVDNLYIGSCPLLRYGMTEELVATVGADRIVFGSDLSWAPIAWGVGPVLYARISVEDKRLILGGNIRRLLGQYGRIR